MYKAVVSDLDGTLLNENHELSDFTIETVNKIIEKGIKFYIATGRNYKQAKKVMDRLGIKIPLITSNGARIYNSEGKVVYENLLEKKERNSILNIDYKKYGKDIHLNLFSDNDWIVKKGTLIEVIKRHPELETVDAVEIEEEKMKKLDVLKIFFVGKHSELEALEKEIHGKTYGNVTTAFVSDKCMEIFSKNANKANAAKYLLDKDGIDIKEAVGFGDGENDLELLTELGKGYVMGNAIERLTSLLPEGFEKIEKNSNNGEAKKLIELFL